jgi:hypothetical protein
MMTVLWQVTGRRIMTHHLPKGKRAMNGYSALYQVAAVFTALYGVWHTHECPQAYPSVAHYERTSDLAQCGLHGS